MKNKKVSRSKKSTNLLLIAFQFIIISSVFLLSQKLFMTSEVTVITTANNWIFIETNEIAGWIVKDSSVGQVTNSDDKNTTQHIETKSTSKKSHNTKN